MKTTLRLAAIAVTFAAAGSAFAESPTIDNAPFVSQKTRAEVQAELAAFKASGVNPWSTNYDEFKRVQSTKTRDQVRGEIVAAIRNGELNAVYGEDSGAAYTPAARAAGLQLAGNAK